MVDMKLMGGVAIVAVLIIAGGAVFLVGGDDSSESGPIEVTDALGRTVTMESKTERIVSTGCLETEMLCGMGASDRIVAVSNDEGVYDCPSSIVGFSDDDFPEAIVDGLADGSIESVGPTAQQTAEGLAAIDADLFILSYMSYTWSGLGDQLDVLGLTYIVTFNGANLTEIYDSIEMIGTAIGEEDEAEDLVDEMQAVIDAVNEKIEGAATQDVAIFMSPYYACGQEYVLGTLIEELGSNNAFSSISGPYEMVSTEGIAQANPDVLIYTAMDMMGLNSNEHIASLQTDPILSELDAVKNDRVYAATGYADQALTFASQRFVEAYAMFAMMIYPDEFDTELPAVVGDDYQTYLEWIVGE